MPGSDSIPPDGFRVIPGFPRYAINENSDVISVCPPNGKGKDRHWVDAKRVKPITDRHGYSQIDLRRDGRTRRIFLHKLVLTTFVEPCPERMECRHIDGNRENNHVSNLVWGTRSENSQDKLLHGTSSRGESRPTAKLTEKDVREIRARAANGEKQVDIAKDFHVNKTNVSRIIRRMNWKHI